MLSQARGQLPRPLDLLPRPLDGRLPVGLEQPIADQRGVGLLGRQIACLGLGGLGGSGRRVGNPDHGCLGQPLLQLVGVSGHLGPLRQRLAGGGLELALRGPRARVAADRPVQPGHGDPRPGRGVQQHQPAGRRIQRAVVVLVGVGRFEVRVGRQAHVGQGLIADVGQHQFDRGDRPVAHHGADSHAEPLVGRLHQAGGLRRIERADRLDDAEVLGLLPADRRARAPGGAVAVVDVVAEAAELPAPRTGEALAPALPEEVPRAGQGEVGRVVGDPDDRRGGPVGFHFRQLGQRGEPLAGPLQALGQLLVRGVEGEQDHLARRPAGREGPHPPGEHAVGVAHRLEPAGARRNGHTPKHNQEASDANGSVHRDPFLLRSASQSSAGRTAPSSALVPKLQLGNPPGAKLRFATGQGPAKQHLSHCRLSLRESRLLSRSERRHLFPRGRQAELGENPFPSRSLGTRLNEIKRD